MAPFCLTVKDKIPNLPGCSPFRDDFGIIDGTYGPLSNVMKIKSPSTGKPYSWKTGGWRSQREMKYESDEDRDATGDELNAEWAIKRLKELAQSKNKNPSSWESVSCVRMLPLIVPSKIFRPISLGYARTPDD